jgi:predicted dehydrogenase
VLDGTWAAATHAPVLSALDAFELRAVCTSRRESAEAAGESFGVEARYVDYRQLVEEPGVDLVVVSVRVPRHYELIRAALEAGKAVYSDWPLAVDLAEARELTASAAASRLRTAVGLQARFQPAIRYARDLIADGYVGRVMATTLACSGIGWGPQTPRELAYLYDAASGVTPLSVTGMHALDAIAFLIGEPVALSAELSIGRDNVTLTDPPETIAVTTPDQVALAGRLETGAVVACLIRGGVSRGEDLQWEINGTDGDLVFRAPPGNGNVQTIDLRLYGGREGDERVTALNVPASYAAVPGFTGAQRAIANLHKQLADDWRDGTSGVPTFEHAVRRHEIVDALQSRGRWP